MGPPREHGGMPVEPVAPDPDAAASMGPPREHGGMIELSEDILKTAQSASMGPPREHGGMGKSKNSVSAVARFNGAAA